MGWSHGNFLFHQGWSLSNYKLISNLVICKPHGLEITGLMIKYPRIKKNAQQFLYPAIPRFDTAPLCAIMLYRPV
jgi:hypothetical protein